MKTLRSSIVLTTIIGTLLINCTDKASKSNDISATQDQSPLSMNRDAIKTLLQGVWWQDENQPSALFMIRGDSLYYAEDLSNPYGIKINVDTLKLIQEEFITSFKLKLLTKDSLQFYDANLQEIIKLVKK